MAEEEIFYDDGIRVFWSLSPGTHRCVTFNPSKQILLKRAKIYCSTGNFDLHIHDNLDNDLIMPIPIVVTVSGWNEIDLSSYNLVLNNFKICVWQFSSESNLGKDVEGNLMIRAIVEPTEGFAEIDGMTIYNNTTDMFYEYAPGGPFGDWVPFEPESVEGDSISIWAYVINNGTVSDTIYGEFNSAEVTPIPPGEELVHIETLNPGVAKWFFPWSFIMPANAVYITINVGHWEGGPVSPLQNI